MSASTTTAASGSGPCRCAAVAIMRSPTRAAAAGAMPADWSARRAASAERASLSGALAWRGFVWGKRQGHEHARWVPTGGCAPTSSAHAGAGLGRSALPPPFLGSSLCIVYKVVPPQRPLHRREVIDLLPRLDALGVGERRAAAAGTGAGAVDQAIHARERLRAQRRSCPARRAPCRQRPASRRRALGCGGAARSRCTRCAAAPISRPARPGPARRQREPTCRQRPPLGCTAARCAGASTAAAGAAVGRGREVHQVRLGRVWGATRACPRQLVRRSDRASPACAVGCIRGAPTACVHSPPATSRRAAWASSDHFLSAPAGTFTVSFTEIRAHSYQLIKHALRASGRR